MNKVLGLINEIERARDGSASLDAVVYKTVSRKADLPANGVEGKIYAVKSDETLEGNPTQYMYRNGSYVLMSGGGGGAGGGGGNTSELEKRIEAIENRTNTVVKSFVEDFRSNGDKYIDVEKTTAVLGTGYARSEKMASIVENLDDDSVVDYTRSNNITFNTDVGAVTLAHNLFNGSFVSKEFRTTGTEFARVDALIKHSSDWSFVSEEEIRPDISTSKATPVLVVDRLGRLVECSVVYAPGTVSKSGVLVNVYNKDGSVAFSHFIQDTSSTYTNYPNTAYKSLHYNGLQVVVDEENKIWVVKPYYNYSSEGAVLHIINPDGSILIKNRNIGAKVSEYRPFLISDGLGKVWLFSVSSLSYVSSSSYVNLVAFDLMGNTVADFRVSVEPGMRFAIGVVQDEQYMRLLYTTYGSTRLYSARFDLVSCTYLDTSNLGAVGTPIYTPYPLNIRDGVLILSCDNFVLKVDREFSRVDRLPDFQASVPTTSTLSLLYDPEKDIVDVFYCDNNYRLKHAVYNVSSGETEVDEFVGVDSPLQVYKPYAIYWEGDLWLYYTLLKAGTISDWSLWRVRREVASTSVTTFLSNNDGVTWDEVEMGKTHRFQNIGSSLRVKFVLSSPNPNLTPEVHSFSLTEGNFSDGRDSINEFVSGTLPSTLPISKATLSVSEVLNDGSIEWFITNNGGGDWFSIQPGVEFSFPNTLGNDLRVKAVIHTPKDATAPTLIKGYNVLSTGVITASDLHVIQVNMIKTNFKINSYMNFTRNAMKNMVIDVFTDTTGIDESKSDYVFNSVNKSVKGGTVVTKLIESNFVPTTIIVSADVDINDGDVMFFVSRDGGASYKEVSLDTPFNISDLPNGNEIVVKAVITNDAELLALGYAWS